MVTLLVNGLERERSMRRRMYVAVLSCSLFACGGEKADRGALLTDTLTQRQRDSIIAKSKLPGAAGVGRALDVADSASLRARAADSLLLTTTNLP
jgi:hypothetical protein